MYYVLNLGAKGLISRECSCSLRAQMDLLPSFRPAVFSGGVKQGGKSIWGRRLGPVQLIKAVTNIAAHTYSM